MADDLEARVAVVVLDVALGAGEEIVDTDHLMALLQQPVGEMRAEEACPAGDEHTLTALVQSRHEIPDLSRAALSADLEGITSASLGAAAA